MFLLSSSWVSSVGMGKRGQARVSSRAVRWLFLEQFVVQLVKYHGFLLEQLAQRSKFFQALALALVHILRNLEALPQEVEIQGAQTEHQGQQRGPATNRSPDD